MLPNLLNILDIFLVSLLLYGIYKLMKNSGALNIFIGVLSFLALWVLVSYVLKLKMLGGLLDKFVSVGAIALIVLFQNEIRRFFVMLGSRRQWNSFVSLFSPKETERSSMQYIVQIVLACKNMASKKTGALIVIEQNVSLDPYVLTGERLDAVVSARLIENIFFKNTPLHDGAMIVSNGKIEAAACILPVSGSTDIPASYGLRHRSALGIAQQTDAVAVVVSEETGQIALAHNGSITGQLTATELERRLDELLVRHKSARQLRRQHREPSHAAKAPGQESVMASQESGNSDLFDNKS